MGPTKEIDLDDFIDAEICLDDIQTKIIKFCNYYFKLVNKVANDAKHGKFLKIFTTKQMLQILPIDHAQVKAGNIFKNVPNEIKQIIYYLHQEKEITKIVCSSIMNSINFESIMDAIFMNSEKSKPSDPYRQLFNLCDKIDLKGSDKYVALSNLNI